MAVENAKKAFDDIVLSDNKSFDILSRLQKRLDLKKIPRRIECFDNSNLFGKNPVSAMAVFENAKPEKSSYRRYNINNVLKPDDYACMSEILKRRFKKEGSHKPLPDLLMVDGGKGQLNITYQIIIEINLKDEFDIIAIAKKDEKRGEVQDKIYKPGRVNHVNFGNDHDLLLFLQMIRDESHRFAISFHRKKRSVVSLRSALDCIPGIGKKRKKALINNFKTIKKVRAASLEDLCKAPGMNEAAARSIIDYFKG
jgi:excinuclease ABC subunit C